MAIERVSVRLTTYGHLCQRYEYLCKRYGHLWQHVARWRHIIELVTITRLNFAAAPDVSQLGNVVARLLCFALACSNAVMEYQREHYYDYDLRRLVRRGVIGGLLIAFFVLVVWALADDATTNTSATITVIGDQ